MKSFLLILSFSLWCAACGVSLKKSDGPQPGYYSVDKDAIVGENTGRYNNRALYINNTNAVVFAGDQPMARLVRDSFMYGTLMLAVKRGVKGKWLHQFDHVISKYNAGTQSWTVTDREFPGLEINAEVVPLENGIGMALQCYANGATKDDKLILAYGGAYGPKKKLSIWPEDHTWDLDVSYYREILNFTFLDSQCRNNRVLMDEKHASLSLNSPGQQNFLTVVTNSNFSASPKVGDARQWGDLEKFTNSTGDALPLMHVESKLENGKNYYWVCDAFANGLEIKRQNIDDPERSFWAGKAELDAIQARINIKTPDQYLNAAARASMIAVDATWQAPTYMHGALYARMPLPGWRSIYGGTVYGWHNRVLEEAKYYTFFQTKVSDKNLPKASVGAKLTEQDKDSRFFGVGHINKDQRGYDMQSQFFDQLIEDWRWTADPELEKTLRPALELHLQWSMECFDPDGDGTYESYKNTWPTDSQWYNGGGSAEQTAYMHRGHIAARDMARRAGDTDAVNYHQRIIERIRKGFFDKLWVKDKGHSGAYREQGGHERLHEDPWLYSIFLPSEANMLSPVQLVESVYYTEWALQNDPVPGGGRRVWPSNWVPALWSVRELWSGDEYALAQTYFRANLPDDGWDIMRGAMMANAFQSIVPGNVSSPQCGTDFGDNLHPFARALVSGLFGFQPDYPNDVVNFSPQFPPRWDSASIALPDFTVAFERNHSLYKYGIRLTKAANISMQLPVHGTSIKKVLVNDVPVEWKLVPAPGSTLVSIAVASTSKAEVTIEIGEALNYTRPQNIATEVLKTVTLETGNARVTKVYDPQEILMNQRIEKNTVVAQIKPSSDGFHTVIVEVMADHAPQWRVFRLKVYNPAAERTKRERVYASVPANAQWQHIDIRPQLNADVTKIYQQQYLSPRPNTSSLRLGVDGYSSWTQQHWAKRRGPMIFALDSVQDKLNKNGLLITPQKVPFLWNGSEKNISFTSMWDNYPTSINFPVNKKGKAVYFLVCGSTNVMQCQIPNAIFRLRYANGSTDSLELVPPFNYWNLCPIIGKKLDDRADYTSKTDQFPLAGQWPDRVQLGQNCRAVIVNLKLKEGIELESVSLETLSQEVVVGLMGISILD